MDDSIELEIFNPPTSSFDAESALTWLQEEFRPLFELFRASLSCENACVRADIEMISQEVSSLFEAALAGLQGLRSPALRQRVDVTGVDAAEHTRELMRVVCHGAKHGSISERNPMRDEAHEGLAILANLLWQRAGEKRKAA